MFMIITFKMGILVRIFQVVLFLSSLVLSIIKALKTLNTLPKSLKHF